MRRTLALALAVLVTSTGAAHADVVSIKPFVDLAFDLLKVAASAAVTILVPWAISRWARNMDEASKEKARAAANAVIQAAIQKAQAEVAERDMGSVDVQNHILASGMKYVADNGRKIMKSVGVDVSTEAGRAELADKIVATVAPAVLAAASVPEVVTVAQAATAVSQTQPVITGSITPVVPARAS